MLRALAALVACTIATAAFAVDPSPGVAAVAALRGAARTQRLIGGAKKEGELMV